MPQIHTSGSNDWSSDRHTIAISLDPSFVVAAFQTKVNICVLHGNESVDHSILCKICREDITVNYTDISPVSYR